MVGRDNWVAQVDVLEDADGVPLPPRPQPTPIRQNTLPPTTAPSHRMPSAALEPAVNERARNRVLLLQVAAMISASGGRTATVEEVQRTAMAFERWIYKQD
jgi:hypothetical protein